MSRLIVFTKAALGYPIKNKDSPFNTYPGVSQQLARLRNAEWTIAIASNEGIGEWEQVTAQYLIVGAQFRVKAKYWFCDDFYTVTAIAIGRGNALSVKSVTKPWLFGPEEPILIRYKTIESTINEIKFIADRCGITEAVFCPVVSGELLHSMGYEPAWRWRSKMIAQEDSWKPGPGMLIYLKKRRTSKPSRCVMVGEDFEDFTAADRANFEFIYSEDFRSGRVTVE